MKLDYNDAVSCTSDARELTLYDGAKLRVTHTVSVNDYLLGHFATVARHEHFEQACIRRIENIEAYNHGDRKQRGRISNILEVSLDGCVEVND